MTVTMASNVATPSAGGMEPGSSDSPTNAKKIAANRSRSGVSSPRALSAAGPDTTMPARSAPTAAEIWTASARPAARMAIPRIVRSSASSDRLKISRLNGISTRSAIARIAATTRMATSAFPMPAIVDPPIRNAPRMGRYTAIARSSMIVIDRTSGVSRFPTHP